MKKILLFVFTYIFIFPALFAEEGMLIPSVIDAFENDMKAMGMKLSAKDIYDVNHASLKDAIIHFGGGCTAEIVSSKGLVFTNHHCGYYYIQQHSSLQNDYLKHGFWAETLQDELPNPGLTATRVVRIEDVTKEVLKNATNDTDIQNNIRKIIERVTAGTHYEALVKPFDYGNAYYCMVRETFRDVRLVGTPPNSIGKFGGDTDNWVWPRHTGDFSVFRIYANKNNEPADYSKENQPYVPIKYLSIDAGRRTEGQFTMIYGFPGQTEQHLISNEIEYFQNTERPIRIHMRDLALEVINSAMKKSDLTRIQYASKQARISNAWKKWIGQVEGLKRMGAVEKKKNFEKQYVDMASSNSDWKTEYRTIPLKLNNLVTANQKQYTDYALYEEFMYVGPELFKLIRNINQFRNQYVKYESSGELSMKREALITSIRGHFKDYNEEVDKQVFLAQYPFFLKKYEDGKYEIEMHSSDKIVAKVYTSSIFTDEDKLIAFVQKYTPKMDRRLVHDPGFAFEARWKNDFMSRIRPNLATYMMQKDSLLKQYVAGYYEMFPKEKHWPDANSTLRISYGKLEGTHARDGIEYTTHTTVDGILAKYQSGEDDFELTPEVATFLQKKEYGKYAQDGEMWVCTLSSNHTTGGNSGSPILNAEGQLLGLNFDRTWESTMSDFNFDPTICRNISVDVRYILWVIDKFAGQHRLIDEMDIHF